MDPVFFGSFLLLFFKGLIRKNLMHSSKMSFQDLQIMLTNYVSIFGNTLFRDFLEILFDMIHYDHNC